MSINPQVVTIVLLSTTKPCRQKTSSSGLIRIACLLFQGSLLWRRRSCEPFHDDETRDQESKEARHEPRPMILRHKIESNQEHAGPQQQAAEEPELWPLGRN